MVLPDTFNDDNNVVLLFNVVKPDMLIDDNDVVLLLNVENPETFNVDVRWQRLNPARRIRVGP
jgi:hypothetical protein